MGEYDDLMKQAQAKLKFQRDHTLQENPQEDGDIYASLREEAEEDTQESSSIPNINREADYSNKPDIDSDTPQFKEDYYIDPNDTPVFEGGPGIAKIQLWKRQYGINQVFHTKILERHFLFRTLNRAEYEQIASLALDSLTNEELICKTCVLWPINYDYAKMGKDDAGFPSTLAQIIMTNSGFTDEYAIEVL